MIDSDEDMQSIVSLLSVNNNHDDDIAPLHDLEDIQDIECDLSEHVLDFTAQLEQLTNSLTGSDAATPMSSEWLLITQQMSTCTHQLEIIFDLQFHRSPKIQHLWQRIHTIPISTTTDTIGRIRNQHETAATCLTCNRLQLTR